MGFIRLATLSALSAGACVELAEAQVALPELAQPPEVAAPEGSTEGDIDLLSGQFGNVLLLEAGPGRDSVGLPESLANAERQFGVSVRQVGPGQWERR